MCHDTGREEEKQTADTTASFHWNSGLNSGLQIWRSTRAVPSFQPLTGLFLFSFNQSEKSLSSLIYILSKVEHIIYSTKKKIAKNVI
jgi:hypothetical protein